MGTHSNRFSCFSHEASVETMETTQHKLQKTPPWYATGRVRRECQTESNKPTQIPEEQRCWPGKGYQREAATQSNHRGERTRSYSGNCPICWVTKVRTVSRAVTPARTETAQEQH